MLNLTDEIDNCLSSDSGRQESSRRVSSQRPGRFVQPLKRLPLSPSNSDSAASITLTNE